MEKYGNENEEEVDLKPLNVRSYSWRVMIMEPWEWLMMLCKQLNTSFVFGVVIVYGLSQGFAGSFFRVVSDYYWKDVQNVQPSAAQLYVGFYYIPWVLKPIWGMLTDVFPMRGYHRRPYFIVAGVLGTITALIVALSGKLAVSAALFCLVGMTAAVAIADVTIDACIARNSIEMRALAPDMQSLCGFSSSIGALIGYITSGFFVHHLGAQGAFGILVIPPASLIVLGFVIYELRSNTATLEKKKAVQKLGVAVKGMYSTIKFPQVWKPSLFMYLSLALSFGTYEGQFYWYTDPKAGPAFSKDFVGIIYAIGAMASIVGVLIYQKVLKDFKFRNLMFSAQLLFGVSGMLDLIFISRYNLALGIPDSFFVISEECVSRIVSKIRWMPMIVLSTRLCPSGIEGTFFALLMCIDSLGSLSSKLAGGIVLHVFHVTRTDFTNLWLVVLLRNIMRFVTLGLIFLVPNVDRHEVLIDPDILKKAAGLSLEDVDDENLQLIPLSVKTEMQL